jgi:hypothetical protein
MSAEEKAKELVEKFQKQIFFDITNERLDIEEGKGCALIAVDEIIYLLDRYIDPVRSYWEDVKQEINKL